MNEPKRSGLATLLLLIGTLGAIPHRPCRAGVVEASRPSLTGPEQPRFRQDPPARGRFLVAGTELLDPNFVESVVLLIEYSDEGALGVIVNRPTNTPIAEILPDIEAPGEGAHRVWIGGPVAPWQLVMLTRSQTEIEEGTRVMGDLYFSASRSALEKVVGAGDQYRLYAGYAGWTAGQLDQEIERGGWRVMPAEIGMVFDEAPLDLWPELIRRTTLHWARQDGRESRRQPIAERGR